MYHLHRRRGVNDGGRLDVLLRRRGIVGRRLVVIRRRLVVIGRGLVVIVGRWLVHCEVIREDK